MIPPCPPLPKRPPLISDSGNMDGRSFAFYKETAFGLWGFVFIRNRRCSLVVSFGFFHEEYLIALVDFIVALRRTKGRGRRTLRSPPSPSSGLHLIHPGYPLRRGMTAAAVYANIGFLYPVQVVYRQFRILFSYLCSGWYRSRFSRVVGLVSFVFHYWGDRLFVPAAT